MRGFWVGSITLVVLYAVLQQGAADRVAQGGNAFTAGLRRILSADVAGIPQRKTGTAAAAAPPSGPGSVTPGPTT